MHGIYHNGALIELGRSGLGFDLDLAVFDWVYLFLRLTVQNVLYRAGNLNRRPPISNSKVAITLKVSSWLQVNSFAT